METVCVVGQGMVSGVDGMLTGKRQSQVFWQLLPQQSLFQWFLLSSPAQGKEDLILLSHL